MLQSVRRSLPLFLAVLCLATVLPGLFLSFEDSEIWGITSSRRLIDHPFIVTSAHYKPLFSLLFGGIVTLAKSDWSSLIASRWLAVSFAAGGLFSLYSLGLSFVDRHRPRFITVALYAIVCTMPLVLIHFTKARSDSVSASLVLITAFVLAQLEYRPVILRGGAYVIGNTVALLITPKSIDLVAALGVIFWMTEYDHDVDETSRRSRPKSSSFSRLVWLSGPLVTILAIALLVSREFIVKSLLYWLDSYTGVQLMSGVTWAAAERAIMTAPVVSFFLAIGLATGTVFFRRLSMREKSLVAVGWIVSFFIAVHSQKYLFFLASRIPFLALGALPGIHILAQLVSRPLTPMRARGVMVLFFLTSLTLTVLRLHHYEGFGLETQKSVHVALSQYLNRAEAHRYWDAIGLFPVRNQVFHYPSPDDRTNSDLLDFVEISHPTMILRTSKMELLEPQLMSWLRPRFIAITNDIYVRYIELAPNAGCLFEARDLARKIQRENLVAPIALVTRTPTLDKWVRVPFQTTTNSTLDELDGKNLDANEIRLADCHVENVRYGITEARPWSALPAPVFTPFFGYDGRL